jgi:GTPase SAR1 family protein
VEHQQFIIRRGSRTRTFDGAMKDQIKVVVVGDAAVGKTSLVASYISRVFSDAVPGVLSDVIVPADLTGQSGVEITVMDTSPRLGLGGEREVRAAADSLPPYTGNDAHVVYPRLSVSPRVRSS